MRTRNGKGRHGDVYPLVGGGHGLCIKRRPLYISAEQITLWWLDSNHLTSYKAIALFVAQTPLTKAGLLRDLERFYSVSREQTTLTDGVIDMANSLIRQALNFPAQEEE